MNRHGTTLRTAIIIGLLCLFAFGRVAYAAQQCYRLAGGGCGGMELSAEARHEASHQPAKVCAEEMELPDGTGSSGSLTQPLFAAASAPALVVVPAPPFRSPPAVDLTPPPKHVTLLTSFGRLRL